MTYLNNASGANVKPQPRLIVGTKLQKALALGTYPPTLLALLGHNLEIGELALTCAAPRQVAVLTATPMSLLRAIRCATPSQILAMKSGDLTVHQVHSEQLDNIQASDAAVDRLFAQVGINRIWAGIERWTAPKVNGSAANDNMRLGHPGNGTEAPVQLSI